MWFDEYSDWIEVVTSSRDENYESLKGLTADWLAKAPMTEWPPAEAQPLIITEADKEVTRAFQMRRFIGISEPPASDVVDNEFLMRFTGPDSDLVAKTLPKGTKWVPQGEIIVTSGRPIRIDKVEENE